MKRRTPDIRNRRCLLTYRDGGAERCFGYLFEFPGRGIYDPTFGKLNVTAEEAKVHNECLSQAEIEGLDKNCSVGLGGIFYIKKEDSKTVVVTWLGGEISREVTVRGHIITFSRKGMTFRGRLRAGEDCFRFKRIQ